jgi:hypothetical protein
MLIYDKVDFKSKLIGKEKEYHLILIENNPSGGYNNYKHMHRIL